MKIRGKILLQHLFPIDLALDVGTSMTRAFRAQRGIVCEIASKVWYVKSSTGESIPIRIGEGEMDQPVYVVRPISNGVVCDKGALDVLVQYAITAAIASASTAHGFNFYGHNWFSVFYMNLMQWRLRRVLVTNHLSWEKFLIAGDRNTTPDS